MDLLALAAEEASRYDQCTVTGEGGVIVSGDQLLLRRLMRNLIENAHRHGLPPIQIDVRREVSNAIIVVADQGPGVAAGDHERIFSPFFRIARGETTTGTGLGLPLVRQIARQHGGEATWSGTPDRPSAIKVLLPHKTTV